MAGSLYTIISVIGLILGLEQIVEAGFYLEKTVSLITHTYSKERKTRLYGEILALRKNIIDAYYYTSDNENNNDNENENNIIRTKKDESNYYKLQQYLETIDKFLNYHKDFEYLCLDKNFRYRVVKHKQKNPSLNSKYPNWYFRFEKKG